MSYPTRNVKQSSSRFMTVTWDSQNVNCCVKQSVYWPGLNDQLEQLILNCQLCLKYLRSKKKHDTYSALGQEVPIFPWTKIATDIFHYEGNSYLLLVDYTSHFPIVRKLRSMTAQHIVDHIKQIFAKYGCPHTLVSDNRTLLC